MTKPQLFLSYAHTDDVRSWVEAFATALKGQDVSVWLDSEQLRPGQSISDALERGLRKSDAVVAVLGEERLNPNLLFEIGAAVGMKKRLILIVPEGFDLSLLPFDLLERRFLWRRDPEETARLTASAVKDDATLEPAG